MQIGGRQTTPAYMLNSLKPGHIIEGPAVLIDDISTVVVEPQCIAHITAGQDIRMEVLTQSCEKTGQVAVRAASRASMTHNSVYRASHCRLHETAIQSLTAALHSCAQVHAENSGPEKPLMECDPIQLAIFSHRSSLLWFALVR